MKTSIEKLKSAGINVINGKIAKADIAKAQRVLADMSKEDEELLQEIFIRSPKACKAMIPDAVKRHFPKGITAEDSAAIDRLPVINAVKGAEFSFDGPKDDRLPQYFVYNHEGHSYLVDTQGFNYPRYMLDLGKSEAKATADEQSQRMIRKSEFEDKLEKFDKQLKMLITYNEKLHKSEIPNVNYGLINVVAKVVVDLQEINQFIGGGTASASEEEYEVGQEVLLGMGLARRKVKILAINDETVTVIGNGIKVELNKKEFEDAVRDM